MNEVKHFSAITLQEQLYTEIADQIKSGKYKPGDRIPPELQLSDMYKVSRVTVRNAIQQLVDANLLIKKQGKGTFVKAHIYTEEVFSCGSFTETCLGMNATPSTRIIECILCDGEYEIIKHFDHNIQRYIRIKRVRLVDDTPSIVEVDYFPETFSFLLNDHLEATSILTLISQKTGMIPTKFKDYFQIVFANKEYAQLLKCKVGTALLEVTQIIRTPDDTIIYVNKQNILTSKYIYAVRSSK